MKKFNSLRLDLAEKTLTPAEKKKREEIAMAMERENPGMPMAKKMAIATAAAKRVAEENLDEEYEDSGEEHPKMWKHVSSVDSNTWSGVAKHHGKNLSNVVHDLEKERDSIKKKGGNHNATSNHDHAIMQLKQHLPSTAKKVAEENLDEISTKTLASAAKSASDPDSDYHYGKSHDPQKFADHAKKTKDAKSAAAVQGAADAKGHYTRPGHTLGSYDKLAHRTPARVTSAGKANKQDVKTLKGSIKRNEEITYIDELKTDTLDSYITKVATGPSRGNTQTGIPKSIKAIGGVTTALRKKVENDNPPFDPDPPKKNPSAVAGKYGIGPSIAAHLAKKGMKNVLNKVDEEIKTTHEDPLVVVKDPEGHIYTHANLSVANAIHQADVKHQAIHTGKPVKAGKFTFELSKHHASEVKEAKEKSEYDYEGDMARGQLQSIIMNAQRVHDMLKDNDNLPEWVQSKITLAEDYISTVSNYMASEIDEEKASHTFEPATHKPTVRNSKGHSFEGNTYNAKGLKGASIYKTKDTGKYYANKIDANTTFHSSAEEAAEKYHNKAK